MLCQDFKDLNKSESPKISENRLSNACLIMNEVG